MEVDYLTDDPAMEYGLKIRKAKTLKALNEVVAGYKGVADDAITRVGLMEEKDFKQFKKDLPLMATVKEPAEAQRMVDEWGDIVVPAKMMIASMVADQFHAPWGTAFIRCDQLGWPQLNNKK